MKLGFIGLGKMGQQMVLRLIKGGHEVIVTDLNQSAVTLAVEYGAVAAPDRYGLIERLGPSPVVWLMIPAPLVEAEVNALIEILPENSTIIDGGNSDYRETMRRAALVAGRGSRLVDVGISGGVLGLEQGFSMMVGGDDASVNQLVPAFEALARPSGWAHFGAAGAGHYIKMIHNGIEYGLMEAYAEGYHLLKDGQEFPGLDLARICEIWQHGSIISSHLNGIAGEILHANPELTGIDGYVAESGEARWTVETGRAQTIPLPVIEASLQVRIDSQAGKTHFGTKLLAAMRNVFGGHPVNKS